MLRQSRQISRLSRNSLNSGNIAHQTTVLSLAEQPQRQVAPQRQLIRSLRTVALQLPALSFGTLNEMILIQTRVLLENF
jgi:hypothetical protein